MSPLPTRRPRFATHLALGLIVIAASAAAQAPPPPPPPLPPVPVPAENPITEAKRVLGKALFWDEQLSSDDTIACGTCHLPRQAGSDPLSAHDHTKVNCALLGTQSDVSAVVAEQGSHHDLVAAVGGSACAGLGRACRTLSDGVEVCSLGRPHPTVACEPCVP